MSSCALSLMSLCVVAQISMTCIGNRSPGQFGVAVRPCLDHSCPLAWQTSPSLQPGSICRPCMPTWASCASINARGNVFCLQSFLQNLLMCICSTSVQRASRHANILKLTQVPLCYHMRLKLLHHFHIHLHVPIAMSRSHHRPFH